MGSWPQLLSLVQLSACQAFAQACVNHCLKIVLRSCRNLCLDLLTFLSATAWEWQMKANFGYQSTEQSQIDRDRKDCWLSSAFLCSASICASQILCLKMFEEYIDACTHYETKVGKHGMIQNLTERHPALITIARASFCSFSVTLGRIRSPSSFPKYKS